MKKISTILILLLLLTGCGAGVIHQTTQTDFQAITYNDAKIRAKKLFFKSNSASVRFMKAEKTIKFTKEGFQAGSDQRQAFCEYEVIGDPYVKDWGAAALDSKFGVHLDGCDVQTWFGQKESALMFAQLLYTLKHQASENKVERNASSITASNESKTGIVKTDVEKVITLSNFSDVDELPTTKASPNSNAYAIVIGIENYRQKLPRADYAAADAGIVSKYLTKVLGYPEENVITLINDRALKSDMEKYFDRWLSNNVEENSRVFIYYSGHGAPNPRTGNAYLVPYDGDPTFITETGYSINRLYESLGKLKAREITVVLDSCFSGAGGRSVLAKGAKPLVIMINMPAIRKNMSVITASSADQISSAYEEQGHGLFTYFLLKGIKGENVIRKDGSIRMDDLFKYLKPRVERVARKQYNNEQTPHLWLGK
ncbi:MAG: caspase family protein [Smithella sp.]